MPDQPVTHAECQRVHRSTLWGFGVIFLLLVAILGLSIQAFLSVGNARHDTDEVATRLVKTNDDTRAEAKSLSDDASSRVHVELAKTNEKVNGMDAKLTEFGTNQTWVMKGLTKIDGQLDRIDRKLEENQLLLRHGSSFRDSK